MAELSSSGGGGEGESGVAASLGYSNSSIKLCRDLDNFESDSSTTFASLSLTPGQSLSHRWLRSSPLSPSSGTSQLL